MRSRYADYFNHDNDAPDYDADVQREENPIRAGYGAVQRRIGTLTPPGSRVLDLGCGTGNTILSLPESCSVTAVDVSARMVEIARDKVQGRRVTFVSADILEYVAVANLSNIDIVVSAYALHHLTEEEKAIFLAALKTTLRPDTPVIIGDLMVDGAAGIATMTERYGERWPDVPEGFTDEFFWDTGTTAAYLEEHGWRFDLVRVSDLSYLLAAATPSGR